MDVSRSVAATSTLLVLGTSLALFVLWRTSRNSNKSKGNRKMIPRIKNHDELEHMNWESVGKVSKVLVYPIKSCKPISAPSGIARLRGMVYNGVRDRSFILTTDKGTMFTGRMDPKTVLIDSTFDNDVLTLKYPGMEEEVRVDTRQVEKNRKILKTSIWGQETHGLDCGEDVSIWLQKVLKRRCNLLYIGDLPANRVSTHVLEDRCPLFRHDDQALYGDLCGYLLMTEESIADLQSKVEPKVAAEDFRPNILVKGSKRAFDEDEWEYIRIGDVVFRNIIPCGRCVFTTVSAETGVKNPDNEPLKTLKTYRCKGGYKDPFFGINMGLDIEGKVSVGDEVFVTRSKSIMNSP